VAADQFFRRKYFLGGWSLVRFVTHRSIHTERNGKPAKRRMGLPLC